MNALLFLVPFWGGFLTLRGPHKDSLVRVGDREPNDLSVTTQPLFSQLGQEPLRHIAEILTELHEGRARLHLIENIGPMAHDGLCQVVGNVHSYARFHNGPVQVSKHEVFTPNHDSVLWILCFRSPCLHFVSGLCGLSRLMTCVMAPMRAPGAVLGPVATRGL